MAENEQNQEDPVVTTIGAAFAQRSPLERDALVRLVRTLIRIGDLPGWWAELLAAGTLTASLSSEDGAIPGTTTVVIELKYDDECFAIASVPERGPIRGYFRPIEEDGAA